MFKKILFIGLAVGAAGVVLVGSGGLSYVRTTAGVIHDEIRSQIPIDFEIKRAQKLIDEIIPEIQACRQVVAQEEVEIEYLQDEIGHLSESQGTSERKIMIQRTSLERPSDFYQFGGRRYSRVEVESDLERTFEEYKGRETLAESKRRLLKSRTDSLLAAKDKLENVKLEKAKMESTVQTLYAQLRQVQALEASGNKFALNDTNLTKAKDLLSRCKRRLDIAQKMIEDETVTVYGIDVESPAVRNVLADVDDYFAGRTVVPAAGDADVMSRR